jgi:hypothetical protein
MIGADVRPDWLRDKENVASERQEQEQCDNVYVDPHIYLLTEQLTGDLLFSTRASAFSSCGHAAALALGSFVP